MKVDLHIPQPWTFEPGQHIFLCIPAVGWWTFHPFSVCWGDVQQEGENLRRVTFSLLVRRRTGFTDTLFQRTLKATDCRITIPAIVEGPYGGGIATNTMESYGTVLLFSAGVGISHQLPFIQRLVQGHVKGNVAVRRLILVWIVRKPEHLDWVRLWMAQILGIEKCREVLVIRIFITIPCDIKEIRWLDGPSAAVVEILAGRPDVALVVRKEASRQIGAMGVLVCGTGSLSDDVRSACRKVQSTSQVDYIEESFTW
ncbi:hypothetical protein IFM58399_02953 [Aspergillus lentulus]|uniref:NADPH oxidase family protein n=1 Tax=Aspergillus lentulus TaxID=293939 RepID=UPI001393D1E6|nr:uncharacterized protein IFM58399_02953 [Aspergillus lentulus]GFF31662.1 hypothetical protein IFM58399_02953 [Aspergillus lentulus]